MRSSTCRGSVRFGLMRVRRVLLLLPMVEMILRWSKNPPGSSLPRGSGEPLGSQSLLLSKNQYYSEREYLSGQQRRTQDPFAQAFAGSTPASRIFKDPFIKCLSHPYIIAEKRQQKHIAGLSDGISSRSYPLFFNPPADLDTSALSARSIIGSLSLIW